MYRLAFEIKAADHHYVPTTIWVAAGIFLLAFGAVLMYQRKTRRGASHKSINYMLPPMLVLSILGLVGFSIWSGESSRAQVALRSYQRGDYKAVEGTVENFQPMPKGGHKMESFSVDGVEFSYSEFEPNGGFNKTEAFGGPIHSGEAVRIAYVCYPDREPCGDKIIVKVEVK